jgi:AcrR family transcriptional regulator
MGKPEPRRRHRRGEGARLRGELIDAASRLLAELGDAERLSVRAVARAAGVTAPSTYRHFPDKRSLVRAVVEERFRDFDRVLDQAQAGSSDPFDALKRRCRAYLRFAREHPGHYRVLFSATSLGPKDGGDLRQGPASGGGIVHDPRRRRPALPGRRRPLGPGSLLPGGPALDRAARHGRPPHQQAGDALAPTEPCWRRRCRTFD